MEFVHHYERAIAWIVAQCPAPDKFAHTYAGLTIWLLTAILMKKKLSSAWPLAMVVLFEAANEYLDRLAHGSWNWPDTIRDVVATLFWPFVISFAMRMRPAIRG
ncbi:hypothetical protein [Novosphingobium sp.]|jgi:hypothetical protein|uniref:hypothetical protein n=1 Tax=Novosphingobium sp. TaxID=1874826 RepID=UPI0028A894CB|nr:hypothetical protein [Novosphingobium sp.]